MPWLNAFGGDTQAPALQHLGVIGYPTDVLVDSTGTIVAGPNEPTFTTMESIIVRFLAR